MIDLTSSFEFNDQREILTSIPEKKIDTRLGTESYFS